MIQADYRRAALLGGTLETRLRETRFPLTDVAKREFFQLVCAFADEMKALGFHPGHVIVAVTGAADEAGVVANPRVIETQADLDGPEKLLVDMVRWCSERYDGSSRGD